MVNKSLNQQPPSPFPLLPVPCTGLHRKTRVTQKEFTTAHESGALDFLTGIGDIELTRRNSQVGLHVLVASTLGSKLRRGGAWCEGAYAK